MGANTSCMGRGGDPHGDADSPGAPPRTHRHRGVGFRGGHVAGEGPLLEALGRKPAAFSRAARFPSSDCTPLHKAAKRRQAEVVQALLAFLASSDIATVRQALAPYCGRMRLAPPGSVQEGLAMAVDMQDARGYTPLMYACLADAPEVVKLLLTKGADPWVADRSAGRTALHHAALAGSAACVRALLEALPPRHAVRGNTRYVNARCAVGMTPLHCAALCTSRSSTTSSAGSSGSGGNGSSGIGGAAAARELLAHGPSLGAATSAEGYHGWLVVEAGSCPLHCAALRGDKEVVAELLKHAVCRTYGGRPYDPRLAANARRRLPWELAAARHPDDDQLGRLLHPGRSLREALGLRSAEVRAMRAAAAVGPPSLAALAAAALRGKLAAEVAAAAAAADGGHTVRREREREQEGGAGESMSPFTAASMARSAEEGSGMWRGRCSGAGAGAVGVGVGGSSGVRVCVSGLRVCATGSSGGAGCGGCGTVRLSSCCGRSSSGWSRPLAHSLLSDGSVAEVPGEGEEGPPAAVGVTAGSAAAQAEVGAGGTGAPAGAEGGAAEACGCQVASCGGEAVEEEGEEEEEEEMCGVCFAARKAVAPVGCGHGLCGGCAGTLAAGVTRSRKPLLCPFCRQVVRGLVPLM